MTENREPRQSRKAATVADLQGVGGRPFLFSIRRFFWVPSSSDESAQGRDLNR